jgi:hypothetical protein
MENFAGAYPGIPYAMPSGYPLGLPGLEPSNWTAIGGNMGMAMAGGPGKGEAAAWEKGGNGKHGGRPKGGFPQQGSAVQAAPGSAHGNPAGGSPHTSAKAKAMARTDESAPAYVTQTASEFLVKNTFLDFGPNFGAPLRPVRSAAGRLDQLADQDNSPVGMSATSGASLQSDHMNAFSQFGSQSGDVQILQDYYDLYRGLVDDADAASGGVADTLVRALAEQRQLTENTGDIQSGFNAWEPAEGCLVVDQKDEETWEVKNTFLTFSPQMKPIRSIRTADGALCSLGDDGLA